MVNSKTQNLYLKIVQKLKNNADFKFAKRNKFYHKKADYKSYGLRIPLVRRIINQFKPTFRILTFTERLNLVKNLYESGFVEERIIANTILALSVSEITSKHFLILDKIANHFNNWAEVDDFTLSVIQPLLQKYSKETLKLLKKWNRSKNMWKRRASVVAFVRKIGESSQFTKEALALCDNLVWDKEDLVQKGVGWALKDNMKRNKKLIYNYIKNLHKKGVSSTIILYVLRNLKEKERNNILKIK